MDENKEVIDLMIFDDPKKTMEEKIFIILYKLEESEDDEIGNQIYSICTGRTATYNDIRNKLSAGLLIDLHNSKIITETMQIGIKHGNKKYFLMNLDDCISVYTFCKSFSDNYDDDFDIEDYNTEYDNPDSNNNHDLTEEQSSYIKDINNKDISISQLLSNHNNGRDV